jgi:hypothetical protein
MANYLTPKMPQAPKLPELNKQKITTTKYDPKKQLEGYQKRLEASGIDPKEATDSRNWLEKALNLTPDQNVFFDIFEILERPQQALFGAWKASQEGKDVKEAIKSGITGNDVIRFKEILHNYGMEDSAKKFGVDDVVGFLGDIFVDPMELALIPATGGTSAINKLTKSLGSAEDALKAAKVAGKSTEEIAQAASKVARTSQALQKAKSTRLISPIEGVFRLTKKGAGATVKFADKGVSKILGKLDELSKLGVAAGKYKKPLQSLSDYTDMKKKLQQIFDMSRDISENVMSKFRKNLGTEDWTKSELGIMYKDWEANDFNKWSEIFESKKGWSKSEYGKHLQGAYEFKNYKPKVTLKEMFFGRKLDDLAMDNQTKEFVESFINTYLDDFMRGFKGDDLFKSTKLDNGLDVWFFNDDYLDELNKELRRLEPDELIIKGGETEELVPFGESKEIGVTEEIDPLSTTLNKEIDAPRFYSDEQKKLYNELLADKDFSDAVDRAGNLLENMLSKVDENLETALRVGTPGGYLPHTLTPERRAVPLRENLDFEKQYASNLKGNVNQFTGRKYMMSAEEANSVYRAKIQTYLDKADLPQHTKDFWESRQGMELFETAVNSSIADFVDTAPGFAKDIKQLDDVLIGATLSDPEIIKPVLQGEKVGMSYKEISKSDIVNKLKGFKKYVPEETAARFDDFIKNYLPEGERLAMDATVYEMIGRLGNQKELNKFFKLIDVINNTFKKWKLFSPGFQMRNILGNTTNMYLAGMSPDEVVRYVKRADDVLKKAPEIMEKATLKGMDALTDAEKVIYSKYRNFIEKGFHDISKEVWDVETVVNTNQKLRNKYDVLSKAADYNFNVNQKWDNRFRMAMLDWAEETPGAVNKAGFTDPEAMVRSALFDPKDLSGVERDKIKRLIPFYTFTKKNLAFQAKNIFENPRKYNHLRKTIRATWEEWADISDEDIESYKRENFWIPIPFISKDGKYAAIKTNLPVGDLAEFIENPSRKILASLSPAIRAPFELATNKQIYTDMPIQEFEGQRGYLMPFMGRKAEYGVSQFGLDVPMSLGSDIVRTTAQGIRGELEGKSGFDIARSALGRSVVSEGSAERAELSRTYEQLKYVQDLMKYYKQENIDILTMAEAENKNSSLAQLSARLKALM